MDAEEVLDAGADGLDAVVGGGRGAALTERRTGDAMQCDAESSGRR